MNRIEVENKIKRGLSLKTISEEMGCGYSTLRKFCRDNGIKSNVIRINAKYPENVLRDSVKTSKSYVELFSKLNVKCSGASFQRIKEKIKEFNIDVSHFIGKQIAAIKMNKTISLKVKPISLDKRETRERLLKYIGNSLSYKCVKCGISEWNNKKLILHIDHIDNNRYNNVLDNLQFLCPNCHNIKTYPEIT